MRLRFRTALAALLLAFSCYLAVHAILPGPPVGHPLPFIGGMLLFLVVVVLVVFVPNTAASEPRRGRIPRWAALLGTATAGLLPWIIRASDPSDPLAPNITWYIGAGGAILLAIVVRRRPGWAWAGILLLGGGCAATIGVPAAFGYGMVGSALWIVVAQLVVSFIDQAYRDTTELTQLQQASSVWQTAQTERRRTRRERIQYAVDVAGPILARVVVSGGALTDEEREAAWVAEGTLRDELRGRSLLDTGVREAIAGLRGAGTSVTLLDEGGLDDLDDEQIDAVRAELAAVLRAANAARVIVRTASDAEVAVTVVGRGEPGADDDEDVSLWHEIRRS